MTRKGIIVSLLIAVLVGVVLIGFSRLFNAEQDGISASISNSGSGKPPTMMPLNEKPRSLKPISFANAEGDDLDLSHWRGKFVHLVGKKCQPSITCSSNWAGQNLKL